MLQVSLFVRKGKSQELEEVSNEALRAYLPDFHNERMLQLNLILNLSLNI